MKNFIKILALGGVVYLAYRYLYPYLLEKKETKPEFDENDGRTTYWGKDGISYVRGYVMPNNIDDFQTNNPLLIIKPDEELFGERPRSVIEVKIDREKNKVQYVPSHTPKELYVADYDEIKDKVAMLNEDRKK